MRDLLWDAAFQQEEKHELDNIMYHHAEIKSYKNC